MKTWLISSVNLAAMLIVSSAYSQPPSSYQRASYNEARQTCLGLKDDDFIACWENLKKNPEYRPPTYQSPTPTYTQPTYQTPNYQQPVQQTQLQNYQSTTPPTYEQPAYMRPAPPLPSDSSNHTVKNGIIYFNFDDGSPNSTDQHQEPSLEEVRRVCRGLDDYDFHDCWGKFQENPAYRPPAYKQLPTTSVYQQPAHQTPSYQQPTYGSTSHTAAQSSPSFAAPDSNNQPTTYQKSTSIQDISEALRVCISFGDARDKVLYNAKGPGYEGVWVNGFRATNEILCDCAITGSQCDRVPRLSRQNAQQTAAELGFLKSPPSKNQPDDWQQDNSLAANSCLIVSHNQNRYINRCPYPIQVISACVGPSQFPQRGYPYEGVVTFTGQGLEHVPPNYETTAPSILSAESCRMKGQFHKMVYGACNHTEGHGAVSGNFINRAVFGCFRPPWKRRNTGGFPNRTVGMPVKDGPDFCSRINSVNCIR